MTSQYKNNKSVAKNPTISIDADDPRVSWENLKQTQSRIGSEFEIINEEGRAVLFVGSDFGPIKTDKNIVVPTETKTPGEITNLSAEWQELDSGPALVFSFDIDTDLPENTTVDSFEYTLSDGTSITPRLYSTKVNTGLVTQEVIFYYSDNTKYFGIFQTTFTEFRVKAVDKDGGLGPEAVLTDIPTYVPDLCTPTITVGSIPMGYSVTLTDTCTKPYEFLSVEEIVSNAATAPTTGYQQVYLNKITPANILTPTTASRWIKARYTSGSGLYGAYSNAVKVTPNNPITADLTAPDEATAVTATWSGNNISISATVPSDTTRFIVRLTNGSTVGFFTKFPAASGTSQTILITEQELYTTLGSHFTSFTGLLILADVADNRNTGTAFTVSQKVNELANVTPTFVLTSISNGYSVSYTLPAAAAYAKVYASTTSGFTPSDATNLVYSGASPGIVIDSVYTLKYVKIKYFKTDGSVSLISAQQSITPADPGMLSLIDNEVKISTNGSILAGDSATSGARAILNKTGIYFYDTAGDATSQLMANAASGSPTFITTNAKIADWKIYSNKIENQLIPGITKFAGLSASGTYAFWAGSTTAGGDAQAEFSVTQAGAVQAKNITISGGSLTVGATSIAASTGILTATSVDLSGKITASSGKITGNFQVESGTFYTGTSPTSTSVLINDKGLASIDASNVTLTAMLNTPILYGNIPLGNATTPTGGTVENPLPTAISFFTQAALIGGWVVNSTTIKDRSEQFVLDSTNKYIRVTGVIDVSTNFRVELGTGTNVFSAGTVVGSTFTPNVYITRGGILNANGANLTGKLTTNGGLMKFGDSVNGSNDGIFIDSNDYWYSNGSFSFASGYLSGTSSSLTINGGQVQFTNIAGSTLESDNNNFAGDPTLTINTSGNLTLGRSFIYNGSTTPTNLSIINYNAVTKTGQLFYQNGSNALMPYVTIRAGDIIMVRE